MIAYSTFFVNFFNNIKMSTNFSYVKMVDIKQNPPDKGGLEGCIHKKPDA